MLQKFDKAFREFEQEVYSKLREYHFDANIELDNLDLQIQAQCLAEDIGYFSMIMRELYKEALDEVSKKMDRSVAGQKDPKDALGRDFIALSLGKLGVAYKSFYFLIRAFHDVMYKLILRLHNQNIGSNSSMNSAIDSTNNTIKHNNPVQYVLKEKSTAYAEWFIVMRKRRNLSKNGIGIGYSMGKNYIDNETTLAIVIGNPTRNQSPPLSLDEFTQALEMSIELTKSSILYGIEKKRLISYSK